MITLKITILMAFIAVLQSAILNFYPLFGKHTIDFICITVVFLSLKYGWRRGGYAGILGGFFEDSFSSAVLGCNAFSYGIVALFTGIVSTVLYREHLSTRMMMVFAGSLVVYGINMVFQLLLTSGVTFSTSEVFQSAILNTAISPFVFYVIEKIRID
ncbi:MAG: rod shape-determining protein MreD [Candidatus Theseobacter exili]|nr:rod shape-determining protein MreD [Candidatus Theseobacter exili]